MAYPESFGMGEDAAGLAQHASRLPAGGRGEGFHCSDYRLVLGIFTGPQVSQCGQHRLGGTASPRSAASQPW